MDLHRTSSRAPVCDAERPPSGAFELPAASAAQFAHPDADVRIAARFREEAALDALEAQITELWGHINAATAQFLALLAEFDRKEGWAQHGMASCAEWLSWQCGVGPVAAREKVRTARALESLPKIAEAFGEGRLSYSKVRALTRVATAATEDTLLHIALNGTAEHVERTVRGFRRMQRENERNEAEAMHERRYLDCRRQSDGSVTLQARLAPEVGEMLLKALKRRKRNLRSGAEMRRAPGRPSLRLIRFPQMFPRKHPGRNPRCRRGGVRLLKVFPRKHPLGAPASGARMRWGTLSNDFSPGAVRVRRPVLTNWWCTSRTMRCVTCRRARARRLNTAVRWRWRRRGGWVATGPCWEWSKARRASRWRSGAGPGRYRPPSVARCAFATAAAASRAAIVPAICTPITSGIGPMAARPPWAIWSLCVRFITARCTRGVTAFGCARVRSNSRVRMAG